MATGPGESSWTVDTLHTHMQVQLVMLTTMLDERLRLQTQALDAAFLAQQAATNAALIAAQRAVDAALVAAEKAVDVRANGQDREFHEHLEQYRNETGLAFDASKEAITKAEIATEKRFDSVNEFREQLADQATRFMPRSEAEAAIARATERVQEITAAGHLLMPRAEADSALDRNEERIQELTDRLNRSEGKGIGLNASWVYILSALAALGTIVSLYVAFRGG